MDDSMMNIINITEWVRRHNEECSFADDPSDCDDAKMMASLLVHKVREMCGDDTNLLDKVAYILRSVGGLIQIDFPGVSEGFIEINPKIVDTE